MAVLDSDRYLDVQASSRRLACFVILMVCLVTFSACYALEDVRSELEVGDDTGVPSDDVGDTMPSDADADASQTEDIDEGDARDVAVEGDAVLDTDTDDLALDASDTAEDVAEDPLEDVSEDVDACTPVDEICNGEDDDCDGEVDEDLVEQLWYLDMDGDTYGLMGSTRSACAQPEGYAARAGDCDDTNVARHENAAELIGNGVDDNCDDVELCYVDADEDGFRTENLIMTEVVDCVAPGIALASVPSGDCRDEDPLSHPGAREICGDGIANDCEGADQPCLVASGGSICDGVARQGEAQGDLAGSRTLLRGDLNGDQIDDLVVFAPQHASANESKVGAAYVFYGPVSGSLSVSSADALVEGVLANEGLLWSLSLVDANQDGRDDLVVASLEAGTNGEVYVFFGPLSGTRRTSSADVTIVANSQGALTGSSVAGGDFDGDGVGDLLIGAPAHDGGQDQVGVTYLVPGPLTGRIRLAEVNTRIIGHVAKQKSGASVANAGDINADGIDDIWIGAPETDAPLDKAGRVYGVYGGTVAGSYSLSNAPVVISGEQQNGLIGRVIASAGDLDGDGLAELLVGAPEYVDVGDRKGALFVFRAPFAPSQQVSQAWGSWIGEADGDRAGASVAAGDVNGDGRPDLFVGAPEALGRGRVYGILSPEAGSRRLADAPIKLQGRGVDNLAGTSIALGDMDGDGYDDLAVGEPEDDGAAANAGVVCVRRGGP